MAKCSCGNQITGDIAYCTKCGKPVARNMIRSIGNDTPNEKKTNDPINEEDKKNQKSNGSDNRNKNEANINDILNNVKKDGIKSIPKPFLYIIVGILAISILGSAQSKNDSKKLQRSKVIAIDDSWISVDFNGYNGYGTVECTYKWDDGTVNNLLRDSIIRALGKADKSGQISYNSAVVDRLYRSIQMTVEPENAISNDDEIVIHTFCNNVDYWREKGIAFTNQDFTCKAKGLEDIIEIDPFDEKYVSVYFEGYAPHAKVNYKAYDFDDVRHLDYELVVGETVDNGGNVTIKLKTSEEELLKRGGYAATRRTKDIEVNDLTSIINDVDQITAEALNRMKQVAEEKIYERATSQKEDIQITKLSYEGMAVVSSKTSSDNNVYLIYKADITDPKEEKEYEDQTVYYPFSFKQVVLYPDGVVDYKEYENIPGNADVSVKTNKYFGRHSAGYVDPTVMFNDLIRKKIDKCDYSISSELNKVFEIQ